MNQSTMLVRSQKDQLFLSQGGEDSPSRVRVDASAGLHERRRQLVRHQHVIEEPTDVLFTEC